MKSIGKMTVSEFIIEKSRFITYLFNVLDTDTVKTHLDEIKKMHPDATHIVYAFITESDTRSNDNGEPKGTAGMPTLEVLRKENMTNILAITVRYFGGIKLGAGGLIRAYTKGVADALKTSEITSETKVDTLSLRLSYKDSSYLDKNLGLAKDVNKEYSLDVLYKIRLLDENLDKFKELFLNFKDPYEYELLKSEVEFI